MNVLGNKNQSYNLDSIFSSCHPTILHGVYDSGYSPQVTLFSATQGSVEVVAFMNGVKLYELTPSTGSAACRDSSRTSKRVQQCDPMWICLANEW